MYFKSSSAVNAIRQPLHFVPSFRHQIASSFMLNSKAFCSFFIQSFRKLHSFSHQQQRSEQANFFLHSSLQSAASSCSGVASFRSSIPPLLKTSRFEFQTKFSLKLDTKRFYFQTKFSLKFVRHIASKLR